MKISIIIPCYNEETTIKNIIEKVQSQNQFDKEIIVVDDFSIDNTRDIIKKELSDKIDRLILNDKNYGKGYSIRQGIKVSSGDYILIQDADLEYDPSDYQNLLNQSKMVLQMLFMAQGLLVQRKKGFYIFGTQLETKF